MATNLIQVESKGIKTPLLNSQEQEQGESQANKIIDKVIVQTLNNKITNSIKSIEESERFIIFLNNKFKLGLADNLIINIQDTSINTKGFFMPKEHKNHYQNTNGSLNYICISSLYLKDKPYETIAHELAHYINELEGHKAKNNYHTKYFKITAEKLLLKVTKGQHGYNYTEETPEFLEILKEFSPSPDAFHIYQTKEESKKVGSRNLLFMCACGCKVRTAKNEDKPFKAVCSYCNTEFIQAEQGED